ncbi:hypothetical protein [Bradyrhizobium sp. BR 10289]|uniref:hypothetical protein n=1 Tax=Bradyrhizobium sp. BR 10289 TaxID=2749993 RepID=UPI001C64FCEA|nr:hypothetical protein [Bradyrhizobium sp. BR 10289]MBW7970098.1 hypothetical protein [Bradyrhizobium sp. BR 10289]
MNFELQTVSIDLLKKVANVTIRAPGSGPIHDDTLVIIQFPFTPFVEQGAEKERAVAGAKEVLEKILAQI